MSLCEFCDETFLKDPDWVANNSETRAHHSSGENWATSLRAGCTICCLLASRAKDLWLGNSAYTAPVSVGIEDDVVAIHSMEEDLGMPLYEGTLLKLSDADGFLITFRPSSAESVTKPRLNRELGLRLCGWQSFNICPVNRSKTKPPSAMVGPRQTTSSMLACDTLAQPSYDSQDPGAKSSSDAQARNWVLQCNAHHATCRVAKFEHSQLPARLIAINKKDYTHVRLIDTTVEAVYEAYTTLSYCWGREQTEHPPKLTTDTLEDYRVRISFDILPKTFQEAIEMTTSLNVYYIWIDSLCIIQDDGGQDFQSQAPHMAEIYGGSYCNIAAANSRNCSQGLYRTIRSQQPAIVRPAWIGTNEDYMLIRSDLWESELLGETLYSRAWVLQERLLAPRVMHHAAGQLFWQCRNLTACSSLPEGYPPVLDEMSGAEREWMRLLSYKGKSRNNVQASDNSKLYRVWGLIVQTYSSCKLTRSSDKLPAIEGIAKAMSYATGDEYCAGLWTNDLVEQLAWRVRADLTTRATPRHRIAYRAPSWAWPSVDGVIEIPERHSTTRNHSAKILELLKSSSFASEGGVQTSPASLRLRGHVFQLMFVCRDSDGHWTWLHKSLTNVHNTEFAFLYPDDDLFGHMEELDWSSENEEHNNEIMYKTPYIATVLMCAYSCKRPRRHQNQYETRESYAGHGLAIEYNKATNTWTRIGLVTFENLSQELWDYLQRRQMTPHGKRHLETEDFHPIEGHTITLT